jgi:hypothetical protein
MSLQLVSVVLIIWRLGVLKKTLTAAEDPLNMSGGDVFFLEEKISNLKRRLKKKRNILFRITTAEQYFGNDSFLFNTFAGLLEEEPLRIQEAEAAQRALEHRRQERLQRALEAEAARLREERAREIAERERLAQLEQDDVLRTMFKQHTAIQKDWVCSICRDDNQESVVSTQCDHHFHEGCILTWARRTKTCPLCREPLIENG